MMNKHDMIYLVLNINDILLACKNMNRIDMLKQQLKNEFDINDLGLARNILGMDIRRDRSTRSLFLSQEGYLIKVLDRFGMLNSKSVHTLLTAHFKLSSQQCPNFDYE